MTVLPACTLGGDWGAQTGAQSVAFSPRYAGGGAAGSRGGAAGGGKGGGCPATVPSVVACGGGVPTESSAMLPCCAFSSSTKALVWSRTLSDRVSIGLGCIFKCDFVLLMELATPTA